MIMFETYQACKVFAICLLIGVNHLMAQVSPENVSAMVPSSIDAETGAIDRRIAAVADSSQLRADYRSVMAIEMNRILDLELAPEERIRRVDSIRESIQPLHDRIQSMRQPSDFSRTELALQR